jgi:hypothetical protein
MVSLVEVQKKSVRLTETTAFKQQFGTYNPKTKKYALRTIWSSMLNSFPFLGKLIVRITPRSLASKQS